jgi:hypothetical protein
MNRELTQDECRDQRTILKILERSKTAEWLGGKEFYDQFERNIEAMQTTGTTDGEELAELTDEDAKERPWVMCKDHAGGFWAGPNRLLAGPPTAHSWVVITSGGSILYFDTARRATENELKQAGIYE